MENNIIEWAKRFASAGYHVFPLYNSSKGLQKPFGWALNKNPMLDGKPVDPVKIIPATNNVLEIDEWEIRIKTGYKSTIGAYGILGIDCVLVDLDIKKGKNGYVEFKDISKDYNVPVPNIVVKTKSGGFHLYFRKPAKLQNVEIKTLAGLTIAGKKYAGVDIRGNGGMIIGPLCEGSQEGWEPGNYQLIKGQPGDRLSEFPEQLIKAVSKTVISNDLENMVESAPNGGNEDVISILRRGEIPDSLPDGQRNEGFYAFINALKNKGIPKDSAKVLCEKLAFSCGDPETLKESVNIEDMLLRIYSVSQDNPYDVARDLIDRGMYQLMSYKAKIQYVIFNENPYLVTRSPHDETSLRTLMARYVRKVDQPGGKPKSVNPVDVIIKALPDTNKVDSLGFKPGSPDIYSDSEDKGARRFLNTYSPPYIPASGMGLDDSIYDEFCFVISRIFGDIGSAEFKLGMDFSAWAIQHPGVKPSICPYLMSKNRGVGKSLYISVMNRLAGISKLGDRQCRLVKLDEIGGRFFNPAMYSMLMFDEVQFPVHKDMRKESTTFWRYMKDLITVETIPVEIKGGEVYQMPNLAALLMAGNSGSHFPIEEYDRRIWVIDNNPPEMAMGLVDRLYQLQKNINLSADERRKLVDTIRYRLSKHKIELRLDTMRAPMTDAKRDLYMDSLSDIEEWWISHFDDETNLLATTPIVSKSAVIYLIETAERLMNTKYREDPESTFRDLKRRGLLRPIRTKGDQAQSRNMTGVVTVSQGGDLRENDRREVLYTTHNHGMFDDQDNNLIIQMYVNNVQRIKNWKSNVIRPKAANTTAADLIH